MDYETLKMFEEKMKEFIKDEQEAMHEVVTFFQDKIIDEIPDYVNLKLYDLNYWISKNYNALNRLNELFEKENFVNHCFQIFCEDSFEFGEEFLEEKGIQRSYFGSSSRFLYVTNNIRVDVLETLKSGDIDWLYVEDETIGGMNNYYIYDVDSIQKNPQEVKNFIFKAFLHEFDKEYKDEALSQLEDFIENYKFWDTFRYNLDYTNIKNEFLSLIETYKELDNFKKSSIVEFLYYLENEVQMEYDFLDEIKKEKFKEGFEIVENLFKKEVGLKEIVMKNTEKILSSLNAC